MGWVFRRDAWSAHIFRQGHRWRRTRAVRVGVGVNRFTSCSPFARLAYALLEERRERENPPRAVSSIRHWHQVTRLPRLHRACPSAALDERVYVDDKYSKPNRPSQDQQQNESLLHFGRSVNNEAQVEQSAFGDSTYTGSVVCLRGTIGATALIDPARPIYPNLNSDGPFRSDTA